LGLRDVRAVLQGKSTFSSIEVSAMGTKGGVSVGRKRIRHVPRLSRNVQRLLQDILCFTHRSFRCNNITLALLHLGL
jgi:ABC-type uncharacterized transport system YnjBCD ATPase subunit